MIMKCLTADDKIEIGVSKGKYYNGIVNQHIVAIKNKVIIYYQGLHSKK